jgi:hypothetical protein
MRTPDREPESPGPLKYEPKSTRMAAPEPTRGSEPRLGCRPRTPGHGKSAPPRKWTKRKGSFEGDVAIKDLRERMARTPDLLPEPPMRDGGGSTFRKVGRLVILVTMTAIAAYVFVWTSTARDGDSGFTLAPYRNPVADEGPGAGPALNNTGVNTASSNDANFRTAVFQFPHVPEAQTDMMRARDEAPPTDGPQVHALVPWPASDSGALSEAKADDVVVSAAADAVSLRRSPPAEAKSQTAPVSKVPRINDEEMPNLLESGRCHRCAPSVSPRGRKGECAGRACTRRDLRSPGSQEPRCGRGRGRSRPRARLVPKGGGARLAGCAAAAQ